MQKSVCIRLIMHSEKFDSIPHLICVLQSLIIFINRMQDVIILDIVLSF